MKYVVSIIGIAILSFSSVTSADELGKNLYLELLDCEYTSPRTEEKLPLQVYYDSLQKNFSEKIKDPQKRGAKGLMLVGMGKKNVILPAQIALQEPSYENWRVLGVMSPKKGSAIKYQLSVKMGGMGEKTARVGTLTLYLPAGEKFIEVEAKASCFSRLF